MHNNVFNFFPGISVVFHLKKNNVFIPILGPSALRLRMEESAVILQLMTYDMGKTRESAPCRGTMTNVCREY